MSSAGEKLSYQGPSNMKMGHIRGALVQFISAVKIKRFPCIFFPAVLSTTILSSHYDTIPGDHDPGNRYVHSERNPSKRF